MKLLSAVIICLAISTTMMSQETKTETLKIPGVCGMCKTKIEKAAKEAGATTAVWDKQTKVLSFSYLSSSSNTAKIEKKIAEAGYDTPGFKATEASYKELDECCQYDRTDAKLLPVAAGLKSEVVKTSTKTTKTMASCTSGKAACTGDEKACCKSDEKKSCCSGEAKETAKPVQQ